MTFRTAFESRPKAKEFEIQSLFSDISGKAGFFCLSETTWELAYSLIQFYGDWRSRYYYTDPVTGEKLTITDSEYDDIQNAIQLALEELTVDVNEGLNAIADAISLLANNQSNCCEGQTVINCGSGGAIYYPNEPSPNEDDGENSPDPSVWPTYGEYEDYKCKVADFIIHQMQGDVNSLLALNWAAISLYGLLELAAIIAATLATPIVGDEVLAVVGGVALVSGIMNGPLGEMDAALTGTHDDLVCALFNAQSVEGAKFAAYTVLNDYLEANTSGANLFVAQMFTSLLLSISSLNRMFDFDETIDYPASDFDCSECLGPGEGLLEFRLGLNGQPRGTGDLTINGQQRTLSSTQDSNGIYYVEFQIVGLVPSTPSCENLDPSGLTSFAHTPKSVSGWTFNGVPFYAELCLGDDETVVYNTSNFATIQDVLVSNTWFVSAGSSTPFTIDYIIG